MQFVMMETQILVLSALILIFCFKQVACYHVLPCIMVTLPLDSAHNVKLTADHVIQMDVESVYNHIYYTQASRFV